MMDSEAIKKAISGHTGKKAEEINEMISAKKNRFSGLLTDDGAAYMVARELGVKIAESQKPAKISELREGLAGIDVIARAKQVFPPKEFESKGKKGRLQSIMLWDGTGEARLTLWNSDIDKAALLGIKKGDAVKVVNCSAAKYNGQLQLNLNYNSTISIAQESEAPSTEAKKTNLNDLEAGMNEVSVKAKIKTIFPERSFENERGKGRVMNFILSEGLKEVRATAWNEAIDAVEEIGEGEEVIIEGAYTKENRGEVELQLGKNAGIVKQKKE
ncbi:Replication factor A [uncultured archaeon]|nr:Replication factor A [uncultured archaeon]